MVQLERFVRIAAMMGLSSVIAACSTSTLSSQPSTVPIAANSPHPTHQGQHNSMDLGPADAEYDLRFIDAMIPHHQGAIAMANEALQKSQRPEIKSLAQNIIKAQSREENQLMRQWRQTWYPNASTKPVTWHSQMGHSMMMSAEQMHDMMMHQDLGAADAQFDLRFLNAMIPHHKGAIVMAADALKKSKRPEIKQLANEIMTSQQTEIDQMKRWRQAWYKR